MKKLIKNTQNANIRYYLPIDEIYDVIDSAHATTGHGGRDRIKKETSKNYANITTDIISVFLSMCEVCQLKKKKAKSKCLVLKPILHTQSNTGSQIDLIDMQTEPDGNFKFILVYLDHFTKFVMLKPLVTNRTEEVAYNVLDIFTIIGVPYILYSNNNQEFVNNIIGKLKVLWPELELIYGTPKDSQSQESLNQDIENMLATWMKDNDTKNWSECLRFIQFMKNRGMHDIKKRISLGTTPLPTCVINTIKTEENFENVADTIDTEQEDVNADSNIIISTVKTEEDVEIVDYTSDTQEEEGNHPIPTNSDIKMEQTYESLEQLCIICKAAITKEEPSVNCYFCQKGSHTACDSTIDEKSVFICSYCMNEHQLQQIQECGSINLISERDVKIGDNVTVPFPSVDMTKGVLLAVVVGITEDNLFQLGTKEGILSKLYSRTEFDICEQTFIQTPELVSISSEGYVRCSCKKSCANNVCKSKKMRIMCNSKCHDSQPCRNK